MKKKPEEILLVGRVKRETARRLRRLCVQHDKKFAPWLRRQVEREIMFLERLDAIEAMTIAQGKHKRLEDGACVMELVSWVQGQSWTDSPSCVSPCIAAFLRSWNDGMNEEDRQQLKHLIPLVVDTVASDAAEERRAYLVIDWFVHTHLVAWLRLVKLDGHASRLGSSPTIITLQDLQNLESALSAALSAARSAAESAAWSAARSAARSAALSAARSAAWSAAESAARSAAWSAAWSAAESAAESAAWSAAESAALSAARSAALSAARSALRPTVVELQASAFELVYRMIAIKE